jgi:hypothetical protein
MRINFRHINSAIAVVATWDHADYVPPVGSQVMLVTSKRAESYWRVVDQLCYESANGQVQVVLRVKPAEETGTRPTYDHRAWVAAAKDGIPEKWCCDEHKAEITRDYQN